jgi:hypothetical protein
MYYNEFKEEQSKIDKEKFKLANDLCIKTWKTILDSKGIAYKEQFNGQVLSLANNIMIHISYDNISEYCISYYRIALKGTLFPYGKLFDLYTEESALVDMMTVAEQLEKKKGGVNGNSKV